MKNEISLSMPDENRWQGVGGMDKGRGLDWEDKGK